MGLPNRQRILQYVVPGTMLVLLIVWGLMPSHSAVPTMQKNSVKHTAAEDSAVESLDTLTAELADTNNKITDVSKANALLKKQNNSLASQLTSQQDAATRLLSQDIQQLKNQFQVLTTQAKESRTTRTEDPEAITVVNDLTLAPPGQALSFTDKNRGPDNKPLPYYTIPANGTSVKDHLMTALVGRIPVKGVVTDPYPFKIVLSDDNLAANGLRIPHLRQMIVSGYCEGDLNLVSVRGWVTSLTFVFEDGTISTTTSNDNDMGNFTKANSLGYLSDLFGNPFIRGQLITNAPAYLVGNTALGAATGAAEAYAEMQTTRSHSVFGNISTAVTGPQGKFLSGQAATNAAKQVQQWWQDREEQSFDAIYVAPTDEQGHYIEIAVNFAKEIHIDYDAKGRKLNYAPAHDASLASTLD
jgi:hypothetical protein